MALHEELNLMLCHGQRECLHLNGLIRKLKSGQAMLMMKRDKAKKELESYVNKLSESLIEFRSEMYVSIQTEVEQKVKEITVLREKYEADIQSYMELCDETEKFVRFGKSINNETDKSRAEQLLKDFRQLQMLTSDIREIEKIMKLEFYPALPVDSIESSMFGDLIRGGSTKCTKSSLSALKARKSKLDNDQITQTKPKSDKLEEVVEKIDQYTQTDTVKEQSKNEATNPTENQERRLESTGYSLMQCKQQQYVSCPQTSPPGFEYVPVPYCTYESYSSHNPPPGFSVYQRTGAPQAFPVAGVPPANMQVNSCMLTDVPVYHQGLHFNQPYTAVAAPNYQVHNAPLRQFNRVISPESACFYQKEQHYESKYTGIPLLKKSCAIPIISPNSDTEMKSIQKSTCEQNENVTETVNVRLPQSKVKNIPLPVGPVPKENCVEFKDRKNKDLKLTPCLSEKTCVKRLDLEVDNAERETKIEATEKHNTEKCIKTSLSEIKSENMVNDECFIEKSEFPSDLQKFEKLIKRSNELTELLDSNYITDEIDVTQRADELVEVDSEKENVKVTEELSQDRDMSEVSKGPYRATVEHHNMEIDQMLSNIGQDLKDKLAKGEEIIAPMRPLRRPLRLPKNYQSESKTRIESEIVSCGDSVSSADSGFIAKRRTDHSISESVHAFDNNLQIKSEISEYVKVEQDKKLYNSESKNITVTVSGKIKDDSEQRKLAEPDILDLSASSGLNLRDVVKGHDPSKREVTELNKGILQSQTKWLKGYLQQVLPENDQKNAALKKYDENNNGPEECLVTKSKIKKEVLETDVEIEMNNNDVASTNVEDEENVRSVENNVISNKDNAIDKTADKTGSDSKETESQPEIIGKSSSIEQAVKENSSQNKGSATDRKTDMKNLKSAVKGFLGGQKEAKQRCAATYTRLGALQAHWLKHVPGTCIEAKFLFKCTHDMHFPIGVATNSLQQIIVADTGNHCVKMFDENGKFLRVFGGDGMRRPSAIVVNEFDHIFVKDDISIKVFDNLGDYIMDIATKFSKPFGLVLTPAKCLLVLETDRRHPALVHVSQDGHKVWKFPYAPLLKAPQGSKCRFMAVSENNVVVSDLGLSQIYITSLEGILFKVIGSPGHGIMQFYEPSGISVDNYGNIVIGDSKNNRIQVFRHDGSYTGLIDFDEKIVRPSGVHLTSDNKLIVVNFLNHAVKVYQLLA